METNIKTFSKYEKQIKKISDTNQMKILIRKIYKDNCIDDHDFTELIETNVYDRLCELGVKIDTYNDIANMSAYDTILLELY